MKKVIRFTADWCQPCKAYTPIWERVEAKRKDYIFEVVDVVKNPDIASNYEITGIPATIIENNGKVLSKTSGILNESQLNKKLDEFLAS